MNFILMFHTFAYALTTCCAECPFSTEKKAVDLRGKCMTVTYDKPTNGTYFDDARFDYYGTTFYTAFGGILIFNENTPQYCIGKQHGSTLNFSINFDSYVSPSDPRFIFNLTSNTSEILDTDDFLDLCSKHGPCREGKFLQRDDILYAEGGHPSLVLEKSGRRNTIFLAVLHDSRPFVTWVKDASCHIGDKNFSICSSSLGTQSIRKLWEKKLPFNKEWLKLDLYAEFSYKRNCTIKLVDTETQENLVDFKGPCGRYADMKRGNWPFRKIGLYTRSMQTPLKMRYRDMELFPNPRFGFMLF